MPILFEQTRSYVYRASRYEILPTLAELAEPFGEKPFLLRELSKKVLSERYTTEQLDTVIKKAQSDKVEKMRNIFGFYLPFLAENLRIFDKAGDGYFRNIPIEEEIAEADAVAADIDADDSGSIYAYSFPALVRSEGAFPIKIGLTTGDDPVLRVRTQCRQTCCFDYPQLLGVWLVQRVASVESAIHSTLEARGSKREAPGTEWFDTTHAEIDSIIRFIQPNAQLKTE